MGGGQIMQTGLRVLSTADVAAIEMSPLEVIERACLALAAGTSANDPADGTALGIATSLLMIAALMQFFDCAQNIGVGLLRGVDDTKSGFRLTVIGYWLVGLPAAGLLGLAAGIGPVGSGSA
jgi:MATE family multidrug resistance protein